MPISKIPQVSATVNSPMATIALPSTTLIYYGRKVVIPAATLTLTNAATQYVKINFGGSIVQRTAEWQVAGNDSETDYLVAVGRVTLVGSTYTAAMFPVVRIGASAISKTPRGQGIPASSGTQALPGSIDPGWFQ
jgi:hypothetical protein